MSCEDLFAKIAEECASAESKSACMRTHLTKDNHSMECAVHALVEITEALNSMEKPPTQLWGWFQQAKLWGNFFW